MASSYFTIPSFNRAKKNKEDLEKTNPQQPVLKDEDEKFFDKEMRSNSTIEAAKEAPVVKITDDGEEKTVTSEEREKAGVDADQTIIPDTRPLGDTDTAVTEDGAFEEKPALPQRPDTAQKEDPSYDAAQKEQAAAAVKERKDKKKSKGMDLPSQEEAEAATRGFETQSNDQTQGDDKTQGEKKTWASYLPAMRGKRPQSANASEQTPPASSAGERAGEQASDGQTPQKATWAQYAGSYVPSLPNLTKSKKKDADATSAPVYKEDGTIDEEATKAQQEREVSVLLDNLNLSSINNRVFSFSNETQQYYDRFLQCLKDVIAGGPTAYEDIDKLMKEAGPKLEEQWKTMPPFVQTLVKSLPMKMGPEVLAMASEKPDDELKRKLQGASTGGNSGSGGGASVAAAAMNSGTGGTDVEKGSGEGEQKKKRKIPGLKALVSEQGAIATLLRNTVGFVQTRFPFLASTTNVVMSLSVFSKW